MKRIYLYIIAAVTLLSACENKRDDNGDLGGMWQLTLWTAPNGDTLATNEAGIYYHFQLRLMKVQRTGHPFYLARFSHRNDSLLVGETYAQPFDSIVGHRQLEVFGVPEDGKFHVDGLSDSRMQLSGNLGVMRFRKY